MADENPFKRDEEAQRIERLEDRLEDLRASGALYLPTDAQAVEIAAIRAEIAAIRGDSFADRTGARAAKPEKRRKLMKRKRLQK